MTRLLLTVVLVTTVYLPISSAAAASNGLPTTVEATLSGSFTEAGIDLNGDLIPGAFHSQGAGKGKLGQFTWSSLSEVDPNFLVNTPRCPGVLDFTYDAFAGVLRYEAAGDLLYLRLEPGDVGYGCLNPATFDNDAVFDFTIVGGTGRFQEATGAAHLEILVNSVLFDAGGGFVFGGGSGSLLLEFD